jgi:hypothetical protein
MARRGPPEGKQNGIPSSISRSAHIGHSKSPPLQPAGTRPYITPQGWPGPGQDRESNLMVYRPDLDNRDRVIVVRYPGRGTFGDLVASPGYLKVMP